MFASQRPTFYRCATQEQRRSPDVVVDPQKRILSQMFWLGLCMTILLSLFCIMLDSERVLYAVNCSCSPRIL